MSSVLQYPPVPTEFDDALSRVGLTRIGRTLPGDSPEREDARRRAFFRREQSGLDQLSLVRAGDGVLRWQTGPVLSGPADGRRYGRAALPRGKVEKQYVFERLQGTNQIAAAVDKLDRVMTNPDKRDLYGLDDNLKFEIPVAPNAPGTFHKKKILLFIHGTFSHMDKVCEQMWAIKNKAGYEFLADAKAKYDHVLAFNHPTLAVSPMVNAFRLAALMRDPSGPAKEIDIICHSRGGLVARWWLEGFADPQTNFRVMFVGSPLGGTSLAAPSNLRSGLNMLSNVSAAVGKGTALSCMPFIQAAGGIFAVMGSITKLAAKTPVLDAACAVFPGLMGQARTQTNYEVNNLRSAGGWADRQPSYFAVQSNFVPPKGNAWKFWRVFCDPKAYGLDVFNKALDDLVFVDRGESGTEYNPIANDLVVDCVSMRELADSDEARIGAVLDFGKSKTVHHTNYFAQPKTLTFFRESFGI